MSEDDFQEKGRGNGRRPLARIGGVILIGLAAVLLIFSSRLFGKSDASETTWAQVPLFGSAQEIGPSGGLLQAGDAARDFVLNDINGNPVRLSDLQGRPVILNFWATWCAPCRVEMPDLQAAYNQHQADGLVILALNREESAETVSAFFYDEMDLTFTPLLDEAGDVARLYNVANYPTSFFVDRDGVVTAVHLGLMTESQIERYLADTIPNRG